MLSGVKRKIKNFLSKPEMLPLYAAIRGFKVSGKEIDKTAKQILSSTEENTISLFKLKRDIYFCGIRYGMSPYEYMIFNFLEYSHQKRKEFMGTFEFLGLCDAMTSKENKRLFREKYETYLRFKPYYGRACMKISQDTDKKLLQEFVSQHSRFVLKALAESMGKNNYIFDGTLSAEETTEEVMSIIRQIGTCIAEEFIEQADGMGKFHPQSVNTLRFVTIKTASSVEKLFALVRMGCGDSHIDNVSAGGLYAIVDLNTGIIVTQGIRRVGSKVEEFLCHPDTGEKIIGASVPRWHDAVELVEKLAEVVPDQRYIGWDLALTDHGWVMVEGNHRAAIESIQMGTATGMKKRIKKLMSSL